MDFKLVKLQVALFVRGLDIAKYDKYLVISELKDKVGDVFDAEPLALPFPPDAPPEIPRIVLRSNDGKFICNIALNRVDILRNVPPQGLEETEDLFAVHRSQTERIFAYLKEKGVVINRVGLTGSFVGRVAGGTSAEYLRSIFIVTNKLTSPKELQVIYNKRARNESLDFNHLIKIISQENSKVVLQIDVNTIPEVMGASEFSIEDLNRILDYSTAKIKILREGFPDNMEV